MYINCDFKTFLSNFTNNYEIDVVKSTINRIANDIAQLKIVPQCIEKENIKTTNKYNLKYLLYVRPNSVMSAYDFYNKLTTNLFLQGNTFIYIQWENGKINSLIPI
ncbi:phage portal protein [Spiroplasma endosymbiont of Polydrusus formosus]|uniref:phage portal protein n=1 Tax=Spiroplasma endosymbiont of Polydrusus formosus TaxID=3139326 RepID=UPI0035B521B1